MVAQWFDSNADILPEVQGWYDARGLGKLNADLFPPTGAVVPGVAAMFCYLTNSKKAYVEGTSSNPAIGRTYRMAAISDCLVRISEKLVELGYSAVWSITAFDSLISVGEAHGFRCSQKDHAYLIKEF